MQLVFNSLVVSSDPVNYCISIYCISIYCISIYQGQMKHADSGLNETFHLTLNSFHLALIASDLKPEFFYLIIQNRINSTIFSYNIEINAFKLFQSKIVQIFTQQSAVSFDPIVYDNQIFYCITLNKRFKALKRLKYLNIIIKVEDEV